ncbi:MULTISPECIES: DNA alkylation repair protein [Bacillus]|uniref:DNA alkylation repair protein n=1 Tax=Bacillus TaxID=1386 RepID=UPI00071D03EA|nr:MULTISPECIES: DNA alkylation repair protein [Bacillus]MDN0041382.1 DNA alkylation repair protein [Bacillus aerophilus]KRV45772.1 DNA alkylation repair protein [Bacillus sp. TH007]MED1533793.1 DNA alkylation repair protein [Bacillus altitudinis]MXP82056.1 DNA alkylation repair protein [Bacillus sp. AN2]PJI11408.1 DNA alkylation repair protein [Bacillus altitudinis]
MQISEEIINRKGARKGTDIPHDVLFLLNQGKIESVNLTEWLAVNHMTLLRHVLPSVGLDHHLDGLTSKITQQKAESGMKAIRLIGQLLDEWLQKENGEKQAEVLQAFTHHVSDSVRCWAAYMNKQRLSTLEEKLAYIQPFAADHHFGVREIAWMSVRESLTDQLDQSIEHLTAWAKSKDENIRRFSVEAIRPRGVWTKHIESLKQEPMRARPILDLLKSDPSIYVQDSVGNWLNDASKTQPNWVINLCEQWLKDSDTKATSRIVKKAKRTIVKGNF